MRKFCRKASIIFLSISIIVILGGIYIKENSDFYYKNEVNKYITIATNDIENEDWSNALKEISCLEKACEQVSVNIENSSNKIKIDKINNNLENLKKSVNNGDKGISLEAIAEINDQWSDINK